MTAERVLCLIAALLSPASLAGCDGTPPGSAPRALGRAFGAEGVVVRAAPSPNGDPLPERGGTVARTKALSENALAPGMASATPQTALRRYALVYTNWSAWTLGERERELASLSVGPARLEAQQTAAARSEAAVLARNHVETHGVVLALGEGEGPAHGWWVVVTQERTIGSGPYAGLPVGVHVTFARLARQRAGWAVAGWRPQD